MVTINKSPYGYDIRLLSTDTKPTTDDIPNGSGCIEINTGKKYMYDRDGGQWYEVSASTIISATGVSF